MITLKFLAGAAMATGVHTRAFAMFASAAFLLAALALAVPAQAQSVSLTIASGIPADHTSTKALGFFKDEVARRSRGSLDIELAPGAQLGGPAELVQKLRAGSIFGAWVGSAYFARLVPEMEAVNLPFVFKDYEGAIRTVEGPVGRVIESKVEVKGFVLLAWMEFGARSVANAKRPIRTVDDFKGLKLFVSPAETFQATFRALGATPILIQTPDVPTALRQGDIDGVEVPYSIINGYRYHEQTKYLSDTNHVMDLIVLVANRNVFRSLTPAQQTIVKDAAKLAAVRQRKMADAWEAAALAALKADGVQFDPISAETRAAMRKATAPVISRVKTTIGTDLVDRVILDADRKAMR
jgi:tripartite ATP-independent transporter DctP family solute receptor